MSIKLRMSFETLESGLDTVSSIIADRALQEDLKNVVIWVKGDKARFAGYNGHVVSASNIDAEVYFEGVEPTETLVQLRAKDLLDVVSSFKGLAITKVDSVELDIRENEAIMTVYEAPIDETMDFADNYNRVNRFRITKPPIKNMVKNEIQKINMDVEGSVLDSGQLLIYIEALLPTVAKETRESTNNIIFGEEHVYTVLAPYTAVMPNKLHEELRGFRLQNSVVAFLKNFISNQESFIFHKEVLGNGAVVLTVKVGESVAVIKCADLSRAFDITNFVTTPPNGIVVDRAYLLDILKRVNNLSSEAVFIEVDFQPQEDGSTDATMKIVSKTLDLQVPVIRAKGEGNYPFSIKADLLGSVIFRHTNLFDSNIFFYFEKNERGNIVMACTDNLQMWHTKMTGLSPAKGDFAWG